MAFKKQLDRPLYDGLLWKAPERRDQWPKVLIVGGHSRTLGAPLEAFGTLESYDAEVSVLLPDSLRSELGRRAGENVFFAPSTRSGSFALQALAPALDLVERHACLFIVGDLSSNQETLQFVGRLLEKAGSKKLVAGKMAGRLAEGRPPTGLNLVLEAGQLPPLGRTGRDRGNQDRLANEAFGELLAAAELGFGLACWRESVIWSKAGREVCATPAGPAPAGGAAKLAAAAAYFLALGGEAGPALACAAWRLKASAGSR